MVIYKVLNDGKKYVSVEGEKNICLFVYGDIYNKYNGCLDGMHISFNGELDDLIKAINGIKKMYSIDLDEFCGFDDKHNFFRLSELDGNIIFDHTNKSAIKQLIEKIRNDDGLVDKGDFVKLFIELINIVDSKLEAEIVYLNAPVIKKEMKWDLIELG